MQEIWTIGIDEAGRGPLAGPVAVGVVKVSADFDWTLIPGVGDSKKVSTKNRGLVFTRAHELKERGELDFSVVMMEASYIDENGIARAIAEAIARAIHDLTLNPQDCFIKLDGSLKAPKDFKQETIIKGDQKELVIGLASILAKETRDIHMRELAEKYPNYDLEVHKGYGTKTHRRLIFKNGLADVHRCSYCQNRHLWGKV